MGPRSFQIQIRGPKTWSAPTKTGLAYNFCFIKYSSSCIVEAVDALQTLFRAPGPWFRVRARSRRSRTDQVDYWEGALQHLCNKLCLKMIDHGSRSTWGPGPSRSRLTSQKYDPPPLKWLFPTTGATWRCPGHYIKILKCIVRAKVARKVSPKVLHLLFNKLKQTFPTTFVFKFFA